MGDIGDEALARRADADSFAELYRRYLTAVYGYFYARLGRWEEAEDLSSTAFMHAWASLRNFRSTGSFRVWLFAIVHRVLADHYRGRKPVQPTADVYPEDMPVDPDRGPEEAVIAAESWAKILQVLRGLAPGQQDVITLRFLGQLTYAEVARTLGKSEPAVKMIAHRALESMRKGLDRDEE